MEAYVSKKNNPFSDQMALAALGGIGKFIRPACANASDEAAREALMLASMQAGMAFSNSSVTMVHGMSRPLGVFFHIPHGMSNAMLVPEITNFSYESERPRYAASCRALGLCAHDASDADASAALPIRLAELSAELKVPTLQEFGVTKKAFFDAVPTMAKMALASGSPNNNPKVPTVEEVEAVYKRVWDIGEATTKKRASKL